MTKDRVSEVMGSKKSSKKPVKKKGGKKVKGMHVRKADSGGYIAKHDPGPDGTGGEEHVLQSLEDLKSHMDDHMEGEETAPAGAAPSPSAVSV